MPLGLYRRFAVALLGLVATTVASAIGFGEMPQSVPFGRSLDVAIPLQVGKGETLEGVCLSARVEIGERSLSKADFAVSAEPAAPGGAPHTLRVRSAQVVDEPVLTMSVSVGCASTVTRQFVVFADPVDPARPAALPSLPVAATLRASPAEVASPIAGAVALAAPFAVQSTAATDPSAGKPAAARKAADRPTRAAKKAAPASAAKSKTALTNTRVATANRAKAPAPARLRLDPADAFLAPPVAAVDRQPELDTAMAMASAAQMAASAATARMAGIEAQVAQLHTAAAADKAAMAALRERLGATQAQDRLLPWLGALLAALLVLVLWLGWRVRALQQARDAAWANVLAVQAEGEEPAAAADAPQHAASVHVEGVMPAPAAASTVLVEAVSDDEAAAALASPVDSRSLRSNGRTVSVAEAAPNASSNRHLSVEELIDLEQQAEFFCVLGQDESAIDLLMAHLRSSGGASPMPYLKLLEIYRNRDDSDAYERIRKRFNQRFNGFAPNWNSDLQRGLSLLDYEAVTARLQQAWGRPLDAMAELETLIFRKTGGELFELPAYRDVLMLYAVARDLDRLAEPDGAPVDVLLPLDADLQAQRLASLQLRPPLSIDDGILLEDRPTAPVDLDLSDLSSDSRFGFLSPLSVSQPRAH